MPTRTIQTAPTASSSNNRDGLPGAPILKRSAPRLYVGKCGAINVKVGK